MKNMSNLKSVCTKICVFLAIVLLPYGIYQKQENQSLIERIGTLQEELDNTQSKLDKTSDQLDKASQQNSSLRTELEIATVNISKSGENGDEETQENQVQYYCTKSGECYHSKNPCGKGTFFACTLEEAEERGLRPCSKCIS